MEQKLSCFFNRKNIISYNFAQCIQQASTLTHNNNEIIKILPKTISGLALIEFHLCFLWSCFCKPMLLHLRHCQFLIQHSRHLTSAEYE